MGSAVTPGRERRQLPGGRRSIETRGPDETRAFGLSLGGLLGEGDFIALSGELGAGKTCFVQGLAAGLGYGGAVTSPTFTLLHLYEGGRLPLYHFDVYRLEAPEELEGLGYEEYFYGGGVCVVEWSDLAAGYLPEQRIELVLEKARGGEAPAGTREAQEGFSGGLRRITMTLHGGDEAWRKRLLEVAGC